MKKLSAVVNKILYAFSLTLFITMIAITTINVFTRYVFNAPIPWSVELGRYSFVGVIFFGAILVMRENNHVRLDLFINLLPEKPLKLVIFIGRIISIIFLVVFTVQAVRMTHMNLHVRTSGMGIPMAIVYSVMIIGGAGMLIELILNMIFPQRLKKDSDKTEQN